MCPYEGKFYQLVGRDKWGEIPKGMQRHGGERQRRGGKTDTHQRMASSLGPWALKCPQTRAEASPEGLLDAEPQVPAQIY